MCPMSTDPNTPGNNTTGSEPTPLRPVRPRADEHVGLARRAQTDGHKGHPGAAQANRGAPGWVWLYCRHVSGGHIGMAVLRLFKGSILEDSLPEPSGPIGESIAAGAVFTLPAFVMAGCWDKFSGAKHAGLIQGALMSSESFWASSSSRCCVASWSRIRT